MHAGNRCWQILTSRPRENREPTHDFFFLKKNETNKEDPTQGIFVWLQPFTVNLEDLETHVLARSSARERTRIRKVTLQKWRHKNGCTVFMFASANQKSSFLRTEKYGDLIAAEHKVFNEGRESQDNYRYAVVVQVLATQWNPFQTKTSQETEKNLRKFPEPSQKPKVIDTDNLLEFGGHCGELSWNHQTITRHRSETSGIAERAVRRAKEENNSRIIAIWIG